MAYHSELPSLSRLKISKDLRELEKGTVLERVVDDTECKADEMDLIKEFGHHALEYNLDSCTGIIDLNSSFEALSEQMTDIYSNQVFKKVITSGSGKKVDAESTVYFHYTAYQEGMDTPYDVSYLRRKDPVRSAIRLVLPEGLQAGLLNMESEEESYILVHPELGYKSQGCAPRVHKEAWLLFRVKLFAVDKNIIIDNGENKKAENLCDLLKHASNITEQGNNLKIQIGNTNEALKNYLYAVQILSDADPRDENEVKLRNSALMRSARNAMVCYNSLKQYREISEFYKNLEKTVGRNIQDAKLLYIYGKALRILGDDDNALLVLKKALNIEPLNKCIVDELKEVENTKQRSKELQKQMSGFLLKNYGKVEAKIERQQEAEEETAENDIFIMLRSFAENDNRTSMVLPDLLIEEVNFCMKICDKLNLKYKLENVGSFRIFK